MTTAAALPLTTVVRNIMKADPNVAVADVRRRVKARGLTASDAAVKKAFYNVRGELKKSAPAKPAPAAARTGPAPAESASGVELNDVLSNVTLVNKVVGVCGGVDAARQVAEAVRACGGVDVFLKHLDTVAGIRTTATA
jgi:hypothetical protein